MQKVTTKLEENKGDSNQYKPQEIYHRMMRNEKLHPIIDLNIFSCYLRLCLGGLFNKYTMVTSKIRINPVSRDYIPE